jgi:tetratricopeptide (TPR) repeat protein
MPRRFRPAVAVALALAGFLAFAWSLGKPLPIPPSASVQHNYGLALENAHDGRPGAARLLYQQLTRTDLAPEQQVALLVELPNFPSTQALKLASAKLQSDAPAVRHAAIDCLRTLVPAAQRSLLLGPLLSDGDQAIRWHATRALLDLSPDQLGLYYAELEKTLDAYARVLEEQPDAPDALLQLARLYLRDQDYAKADTTLQRLRTIQPDNPALIPLRMQVFEGQHLPDQAREVLAEPLRRDPQSALLQTELGHWLLRHGAPEYALLALTRAVELAPDNPDYRYDLAVALHGLDQLQAAQHQLDELLRRNPANRRARVLLIQYWKESGQLQNVQVLLAELEQQNPDDPVVQAGF